MIERNWPNPSGPHPRHEELWIKLAARGYRAFEKACGDDVVDGGGGRTSGHHQRRAGVPPFEALTRKEYRRWLGIASFITGQLSRMTPEDRDILENGGPEE